MKTIYPLISRVAIPATTPPGGPLHEIVLKPAQNHLAYIDFIIPMDSFAMDAGVRIYNHGVMIYPEIGSRSDPAVALGPDNFGPLATSRVILRVEFNRRLRGSPYDLTFQYYNEAAAILRVNVVAGCYNDDEQKTTDQLRESKGDKTVEVKIT